MRSLSKKMLRDLWQIRGRALAVAMTAAAGVGIYAGAGMAIHTGGHTRDVLLGRMQFADLEVQFLPEDVANLPDLGGIPGVRGVERRLVMPGTVFLKDDSRISGMLVFLENPAPTLDRLELVAGRPVDPGDFESAVVERSLAIYHDFAVGDRIRVKVGEKTYDSRVDGVVVSPEYLITTANPDYLLPEKGSLGVIFTSLDRVSDSLGFTMVNDLLFRFEPGADPRAVREAVTGRLAKLNLERVMPKQEHFIWRFLQVEMDAFELYTPCIVLTLGLLSFVLTFISVNRLVLDQRQEIGSLLALGYRRAQVLRAYMMTGVIVGAVGGVLGMGLSLLLRDLLVRPYGRALGIPEIVTLVEPARMITGCLAAIVVTATAGLLPPLRMLRLTPQSVIREPIARETGLGRWAHGSAAALAALPLVVRYGIRNLVRRRSRTLSSVLAIGFSLGVPIAYLVSLTSTLETPARVFARERWDFTVDFLYPVLADDIGSIGSLPGVLKVEPYFRRFAEIGAGGQFESASILGIQTDSVMRRTSVKEGRGLSGGPDEVIVSHDLARRLGLHVGDPVTIRIRNNLTYSSRVVGVSGEIIPGQITMPFRRAQEMTGFQDQVTGVYLSTSGPAEGLAAALGGLEYVAKVTRKDGVVEAFRKMVSGIMRLVYVSLGVSIFSSTLFIAMSVSLVISERRAEYATFRCLGYGRRKLGAMVLVHTMVEGGLASLVSIPVGVVLGVYLNARMSRTWYHVFNIFRAGDFTLVLAVALVLMPLAAWPAIRTLNRLVLVDALATRRIG